MKTLALILALVAPSFATGTYGFPDPKLNAEFEKNYYEHKYGNFVNLRASSATISGLNVSSGTVTGLFTINKSTITTAHVGTLTFGTLGTPITGRVVNTYKFTTATTFATTNTAFQTSNLLLEVTPTSTASAFVIYATGTLFSTNVATSDAVIAIFAGASNLGDATWGHAMTNAGNSSRVPTTILSTHGPGSTSAITYSVKLRSGGGASVTFGDLVLQTLVIVEVLP